MFYNITSTQKTHNCCLISRKPGHVCLSLCVRPCVPATAWPCVPGLVCLAPCAWPRVLAPCAWPHVPGPMCLAPCAWPSVPGPVCLARMPGPMCLALHAWPHVSGPVCVALVSGLCAWSSVPGPACLARVLGQCTWPSAMVINVESLIEDMTGLMSGHQGAVRMDQHGLLHVWQPLIMSLLLVAILGGISVVPKLTAEL